MPDTLEAIVRRLVALERRLGQTNTQEVTNVRLKGTTDGLTLTVSASGSLAPGYPALSGLSTGAVLRATGATTSAFGTLDLADADARTGILPPANGGTGVNNGTFALTVPATGTAALGTGTANYAAYWSGTNTLAAEATLAVSRGGWPGIVFAANKGGSNQTGISPYNFTKVTFGTEDIDTHGYFDTTNSKYTPLVAGKYLMATHITWSGSEDQAQYYSFIYKNGSRIRDGFNVASGTAGVVDVSVAIVEANGSTDYFEVYCYAGTVGNQTIDGGASITTWTGVWVSA